MRQLEAKPRQISLIKKAGRTILFVSHDLDAVERFCDRVILLEDGQLRCDGKPEQILATYVDGGRGSWFVGCILRLRQNVVAMCDVNEHKARLSFEQLPEVRKFNDFRKMLDEMDKQIDAVVIATPDNTHAVISATAMEMGCWNNA